MKKQSRKQLINAVSKEAIRLLEEIYNIYYIGLLKIKTTRLETDSKVFLLNKKVDFTRAMSKEFIICDKTNNLKARPSFKKAMKVSYVNHFKNIGDSKLKACIDFMSATQSMVANAEISMAKRYLKQLDSFLVRKRNSNLKRDMCNSLSEIGNF